MGKHNKERREAAMLKTPAKGDSASETGKHGNSKH